MNSNQHIYLRGLCALLLFLPALLWAKPFNIATLSDGSGSFSHGVRALIRQETSALIGDEFEVRFPRSMQVSADHDPRRLQRVLGQLLERADVHMVIGIGPVSSHFLASRERYKKALW